MAFASLRWFSKTLQRHTETWVLLPDIGDGPFAVLYLLHGLSDDHSIWMRRTSIERYVAGLPLIVVMPDGGRSFYVNHHGTGPRWGDHLAIELPAMIERTFDVKATRDGRFIGGLSMGGYGALRIALAYPERYASAHSHSGALLGPRDVPEIPEFAAIVGPGGAVRGTDHDLLVLAKRAKNSGVLPRIRIDCGVDDFLIEPNRSVHRQLIHDDIDHGYEEFPGAHTWDYWDMHIREAIAFHLRTAV